MTDITPTPDWTPVRQLETTDKVLGGPLPEGVANLHAQALSNQNLYARKHGGTLPFFPGLTYDTGDRVKLASGAIVVSEDDGNVTDPNTDMTGWVNANSASQIVDESGETQQELNEKLKRGYVTPYDFGYADGLDYGYYLQLAIDSGKKVMGSYKKEDQVRANTAVYVTNDTQQVDCSMIQTVESYIEQGDEGRLKGFINLQPKVLNQLNWINATSIPEVFSNAITLESTVGLSVGDYVIISTRHAIEDSQSKTGFITSIIGNTILTNYIFGTIPTTLRVAKSNYVKGNVIKAPQSVSDKITESQDKSKMIGGIVANRAVEYKISGTNLIEGANPTFLALHCHNGQDYGMQNTRPRVTAGGQGYAVQINHSTYCKSYFQRSVKGRHLVDFTGGGWNDAYDGIAIDPVHTALGTHGNYEHDCNFHNMRTNTAIGVWGNYSASIADSDERFGNTSVRCNIIGGKFGGGFHISAKSISCNILNKAEFNTPAFNYISPRGGLTLSVITNAGVIFDSTEEIGDIDITDSKTANLVFQQYCNDVVISNSEFADIRTPNASKPRSITVTAGSKLKPTLDVSNIITAQKFIKFNNSEVFGSAVNAGYFFDCPIVSVASDVTIRNSVNFHATASNYFEFNGKFEDVDTSASRTAGVALVQQRSESGLLLMTNPIIRTSGAVVNIVPFRVASTSQSFVSKGLIINGGYVEGTTEVPNHVTLGKLDTISINGTLFKDDSAILAIAQTSKIKINGIKL